MIFREYVKELKKKIPTDIDFIAQELGIGRTSMYDLIRIPPKGVLGVIPRKKLMIRIIEWTDGKVMPNDWYCV